MNDHAIFGIAAGTAILGLVLLFLSSFNTGAPVISAGYAPEVYGSDVCKMVQADLSKPVQFCSEEGRQQCKKLHPTSPTRPINLCYLSCYRNVREQCKYAHSKISNNWRRLRYD